MEVNSRTLTLCRCNVNASSSSVGKHPTPVWKNQLVDANGPVMELTAKTPRGRGETWRGGGGRQYVTAIFHNAFIDKVGELMRKLNY